ncbi:TPA: caspase family protein [Legionella pneumophila]|nr:caspase family protein [Legionella pneumophila]
MRKALIVGIDYYRNVESLTGCVNDAYSVNSVLDRHSDGTLNFDVKTLTCSGESEVFTRNNLKTQIKELFAGDTTDTALFYFAGHGYIDATSGYLVTSDAEVGDDGVSINEIMSIANDSKVRNKIIVLDSCHSGIAGASANNAKIAELKEGVTILSASTDEQYASEENNSGLFTSLFVEALNGGAANLVGEVTPGSVYAFIDQSLGSWEQRPVFKTNVKSFISLRKVQPPISLTELRRITELFPSRGHEFNLDPSFEPTSPSADLVNTQKFATLQAYNRVNLVVPSGAEHMYFSAMEYKSCKLTFLGEHYHKLVLRGRI